MTSEVIEKYLKSNLFKPATVKSYRTILSKFDREYNLFEAKEEDVASFLGKYQMTKTQRSYKTILNAFYSWAIRQKIIELNPAAEIDIRGNQKTARRPLMEQKHLKILLDNCKDSEGKPKLREQAIVYFLFYTGLRGVEVREMKISDIDLEREVMWIGISKTDSRATALHPRLIPVLKKYLEARAQRNGKVDPKYQDYLFLNKHGRNIKARAWHFLMAKIRGNSKIRFTGHDFRRAYVTHIIRKTDITTAQTLIGHKSLETTRKYFLEDQDEDFKKFKGIDF